MYGLTNKIRFVPDENSFLDSCQKAFSAYDYKRLTEFVVPEPPKNAEYPLVVTFFKEYVGHEIISYKYVSAKDVYDVLKWEKYRWEEESSSRT